MTLQNNSQKSCIDCKSPISPQFKEEVRCFLCNKQQLEARHGKLPPIAERKKLWALPESNRIINDALKKTPQAELQCLTCGAHILLAKGIDNYFLYQCRKCHSILIQNYEKTDNALQQFREGDHDCI